MLCSLFQILPPTFQNAQVPKVLDLGARISNCLFRQTQILAISFKFLNQVTLQAGAPSLEGAIRTWQ